MKHPFNCFLLPIILLSVSINVSGTDPVDSSGILYTKTLKQIGLSEFDSALLTIRDAYAHGLSDDSLFYAWAEIYNARGALDTAIALSLAIKNRPEHPLYYSVLKQRYLLFTLTNQTKRAESVLDTLNRLPAYRLRYLIPEISLFARGGIQQNSIKEAEILPSYLDYAYPEDESARPAASGGLNLLWKYPIRKTMGFELTAGANLYQYNPPHPFLLKNAFDSSYMEEHVELGYYLLSGMISCSYEFSSLHEYSGSVSFRHKTQLSASTFIKDFFVFGNGAYSYDAGGKVHNWNGILFGSRDWSKRRSNSLVISVIGVHTENDTLFDYGEFRKMYVDGTTFYADSTYLDQKNWKIAARSATTYPASYISMILPGSYITAKLSVSQHFALSHGFKLSCSFDGAATLFTKVYKWADNLVDASGKPTYIFDRSDNTWYWASNLNPLLKDTEHHPLELVHKKKRVDQAITANVSLKKNFKNNLTIGVNGTVSRTFSNLRSNALVDIPEWSYSVMAFTTFRFNPAGRIH